MATGSLLALLDDIVSVLDDVATMTKVATKKTAGVLGDDLALNAQQVSGVQSERELPVIWRVAKGSFVNKLILVPTALVISAFANMLIVPLLMCGGAYLCFEGAEKLVHKFMHRKEEPHKQEPSVEKIEKTVASETDKIKGAIRTDFILSAEIIVIALGSIDAGKSIWVQLGVLSAIAIIMTIGVYGLVAGIVKLDDIGLHLVKSNNESSFLYRLGKILVNSAPYLMRFLTVIGTAAMFMVGGGILVHGIPYFHHITAMFGSMPFGGLADILFNAVCGMIAGAVLVVLVSVFAKLKGNKTAA